VEELSAMEDVSELYPLKEEVLPVVRLEGWRDDKRLIYFALVR
jgi:hypothetical protein